MKTLGFIGTGTIVEAFIEGLVASGKTNPIILSPRSEAISKALAERYPQISRAASNAEVADAADIVFLGMRPPQVEDALKGVAFHPGQIVCSFVAGFPVADVASVAPAATVCRVLPLPAIEVCRGPVAHYPRVRDIVDLLAGMGEVVIPSGEEELAAMGAVSGAMSTFMEIQDTLVGWMVNEGTKPDIADTYIRAMFSGLAETAFRSDQPLSELADDHQTKGGLNERTRRLLTDSGWFEKLTEAIETVRKVRREDLV